MQVSTGLMADERWEWEEGGILDTKGFLAVPQAELGKSGWALDLVGWMMN